MARIQHAENAGTSDPTTGVFGLTFTAAAANDLIVINGNSDSTIALSTSGYTNAVTDINGNGCYVWYKIATGGETSVTFVTGTVGKPIAVGMAEYSGIQTSTPLTATAKAYTLGNLTSAPLLTASPTITLSSIVVAYANLKGLGNGVPTAATWTNTLTNFATSTTGGTGTADCWTSSADLLTGSTGAFTTQASWTPSTGADIETCLVAFSLATGATPSGNAAGTGAALLPSFTISPTIGKASATGSAFTAAINPTASTIGFAAGTGSAKSTSATVMVTPGWTRNVVSPLLLKDGTAFLLKNVTPLVLKAG